MPRNPATTIGAYAEEITVVAGAHRIVSWHVVILGTLTALMMHTLISLLGIPVGFGIADQAVYPAVADEAAVGAALWWAASGILSAFTGGAAQDRRSTRPFRWLATAAHGPSTASNAPSR